MVSICLLTFNRAEKLSATIESILNQTYSNFELIISDDFSSDNTLEICKKYELIDSRIIYIRNNKNLGMPGNLNSAIKLAKFEYIANLHDGDIFKSNLIQKWVDALDANPTAGFVFNAYESKLEDGSSIIYKEQYPEFLNGNILAERLLSRWDSCVFGTVMCRKTVYVSLNYFDYKFCNYSDIDMWLRILKNYDVAYINEPLMVLMEKDKSRFYGFVHWQVIFWLLMIHKNGLENFKDTLPKFTNILAIKYTSRRRKLFFRELLICIKHRRFDRVKEAFAIWKDSDDWLFKIFGFFFGDKKNLPEWYDKSYWQLVKI